MDAASHCSVMPPKMGGAIEFQRTWCDEGGDGEGKVGVSRKDTMKGWGL